MSSEEGSIHRKEQMPHLEWESDHEELAGEDAPLPPPFHGQIQEPRIALEESNLAVEPLNPNREVQQCQRPRWSMEEDNLLRQLVEERKLKDWVKVSGYFERRSARACAYHYEHKIKSSLKGSKDAFTKQEDTDIRNGYRQFPKKWTVIAYSLPGRSSEAVRRRYHKLEKEEEERRMRHGLIPQPALSTDISEGDVPGDDPNAQPPSQENAEQDAPPPGVLGGAKRKAAAWMRELSANLQKKFRRCG